MSYCVALGNGDFLMDKEFTSYKVLGKTTCPDLYGCFQDHPFFIEEFQTVDDAKKAIDIYDNSNFANKDFFENFAILEAVTRTKIGAYIKSRYKTRAEQNSDPNAVHFSFKDRP